MPCSITVVGARPQSHITALNAVTWTIGMSDRVRQRVHAAGGGSGRGVVLDVDSRDVDAGAEPGPALQQFDLGRALQHDDIDRAVPQLVPG